jgi:hypothetical protein
MDPPPPLFWILKFAFNLSPKCRDFLNPEQSIAHEERGHVEIGPGPFYKFFAPRASISERGRLQWRWVAASCFGLCAAVKRYPRRAFNKVRIGSRESGYRCLTTLARSRQRYRLAREPGRSDVVP